MDPQKFNEYEQREAKNFILLDSSKEELTSSNLFIFIDFAVSRKKFLLGSKRLPPKSPTHSLRKSVSDKSCPVLDQPPLDEIRDQNSKLATGPFFSEIYSEPLMKFTKLSSTMSI